MASPLSSLHAERFRSSFQTQQKKMQTEAAVPVVTAFPINYFPWLEILINKTQILQNSYTFFLTIIFEMKMIYSSLLYQLDFLNLLFMSHKYFPWFLQIFINITQTLSSSENYVEHNPLPNDHDILYNVVSNACFMFYFPEPWFLQIFVP